MPPVSTTGVPTVTAGYNSATVKYVTSSDTDINNIIVLMATSTITDIPVDGTTYSSGNTIGTSTVVCIDMTTTASTSSSCNVPGLTSGIYYYFKVFAKDIYGNYSVGIAPSVPFLIPINESTIVTNGSLLSNVTIAPGSASREVSSFALHTTNGLDTITGFGVTFLNDNASSTNKIEIINDAGTVVYGSTTVTSVNLTTTNDFESNAISPLTTSGDGTWTTIANTHDGGSYVAASGAIGNSKTESMQLAQTLNTSATISFALNVSSEVNYDLLTFYIDGVSQDVWSGTVPWTTVSYPVSAGSHTFTWTYSKDVLDSAGSDQALIDSISIQKSGIYIPLDVNSISVSTSSSLYKVRITPKSQSELPSPSTGILYPIQAIVTDMTLLSANNKAFSNTASTTVTIDNESPATASGTPTVVGGSLLATVSFTSATSSDLASILILRATSTITDTPVEGTSYTAGNTIGSSVVAIATSTSPSTVYSLIDTGLTNGTAYYYKLFAKDTYGNYSIGLTASGSPVTPAGVASTTVTLASGNDPTSITIAPGATATSTDAFTFQTNTGTDVITAVVVSLSSASSTSLIEITSDDGTIVYGSISNPTGTSTSITLSNNTLTANTTLTQYKIRVTAKSQANLPVGSDAGLYPIATHIDSWTGTNTNKTGYDLSNTSVIIDNLSVPNFGITNASTSFATQATSTAGTNPQFTTIGDLNNDGKLDVVVANLGSTSISIFLNTSTSTFSLANKVDYTTGTNPESVSIGDLNNDGKMDLAVANYTSNSVSTFLNTSTSTFSLANKVDYTTGTGPTSVAIGDFNNDGKADLAVANFSSSSVSIFLNTSTSTFSLATKVDYTTGSGSQSVAIGDLNNDGKLDLAVANGSSASVSTLLNTSTSTISFSSKVDYTTGTGPISVAIGDLDNDGKLDLAVANGSSASVSTFLNTSTSTFSLANKVDYTTGTGPHSVAISDLNNDGKMDLAVANYAIQFGSTTSIFLNTSTSTFSLANKVDYTTGTGPSSVVAGDVNNDGKIDLVVANYNSVSNSMSVLLNNSTTTLANTAGSAQVSTSYTTPPTDDFDSFLILYGTSTITQTPVDGTSYSVGNNIGTSTVGCIDTTTSTSTASSCITTGLTAGTPYYFKMFVKDVYGNYSLGVTPSGAPTTPTTLVASTTLTSGVDPVSITIAPGSSATSTDAFTFQTNTGTDVITALTVFIANASSTSLLEITSNDGLTVYGSTTNPTGTTTSITLNNSTLTATTATTTYKIRITPKSQANLPTSTSSMLYLVTTYVSGWTGTNVKSGTDTSSTTVVTIDNISTSSFGITTSATTFTAQATTSITGTVPWFVAIGDLNNDGKRDLAVANSSSTSVSIFLNTSTSTISFATKVDYTTGGTPVSVAIGDLNNDGYIDLVAVNGGSASVSVLRNSGNGTFATNVDFTTGDSPFSVAIGDLNNDGKRDLAVANSSSTSVSIFLNTSTSTISFATKVDYTTGDSPYSVAIGDLNNDGLQDLAVANTGSASVSTFLNSGNGTFATKVDYTTGNSPFDVAIGDLNNDGLPDLAIANYNSASVSTLLNNGNGTFATKVDYTTWGNPVSIAIGDLNNDGYADLATANYTDDSVSTFLNNGNGTFATLVNYTTGTTPASVAIGDLNNDGKNDLAVANFGSNSISTIRNTSPFSLSNTSANTQVTTSYTTPPSDYNSTLILYATSSITQVPVDGTTYSVGNTIGTSTVGCIDTNTSTSTARTCTTTGLTNGTTYYFKAFVKDNYGNYSIGVVPTGSPTTPNKTTTLGSGTDPASVTLAPGGATTTLDAFTFQTDAATDTITALTIFIANASSTSKLEITNDAGTIVYGSSTNPTATSTSITLNNATLTASTTLTQYKIRITPKTQANLPTATSSMLYPVTAFVSSWTGTNTNKQGSDTSSTTVVTIDNISIPSFGIATSSVMFDTNLDFPTGIQPYTVATGDFNKDGREDIVVTNNNITTGTTMSILMNTSTSTVSFANKVDYTTGESPMAVAVGDLNNDGFVDIVVTNDASSTISIFLNKGNGTFANKVDYPFSGAVYSIVIGDLNNDGKADLVATDGVNNLVSIFMNTSTTTISFATKVDYTTGSNPNSVAIGDLNNDGKMDLAVANFFSDSVSIFINNGNGTFASKVDYTTGTTPVSVAIGDLNNDGKMDLAVVNYSSASVSTFLNNGNGTFATKVDYTTGNVPDSVAIDDLNNDGFMDILTASTGQNAVIIFLNDSLGNFTSTTTAFTGFQPNFVATADFNNDGKVDIITPNIGSDSVSVIINISTSALTTIPDASYQITTTYTTPPTPDLSSILILYSTSTISAVPVDGTTYATGTLIGTATVGCVDTTTATSTSRSCTTTGLTNGTDYYFKVFVKDTYGNYSIGIIPDISPIMASTGTTQLEVSSYRFRNDNGNETSATYTLAENTGLTSSFILGDATRIRFAIANKGSSSASATFALEYATSSCTVWSTVPRFIDAVNDHFKIDSSPYVADNQVTTHSTGMSVPNGKTFVAGRIQTFNASTQSITLSSSQYTEVEYMVRSTGKMATYTPYCFRLSNAGNVTGFTYPNTPQIMSYAKEFRFYGGGGIGGGSVQLEAPSAVGTTTVTGGGNAGGSASTTDATTTPNAGQSTTTPQQGGGSGGDLGFFYPSSNHLGNNGYVYNSDTRNKGMVLGASATSMCVDMKNKMSYGSMDKKTQGEVSQLQYYLRLQGYFFGSITGMFGNATRNAVKDFQRENHLYPSGIVGTSTRERMHDLGCIKE
jgi:hypothetical protein